jgi:hypothetical protein
MALRCYYELDVGYPRDRCSIDDSDLHAAVGDYSESSSMDFLSGVRDMQWQFESRREAEEAKKKVEKVFEQANVSTDNNPDDWIQQAFIIIRHTHWDDDWTDEEANNEELNFPEEDCK